MKQNVKRAVNYVNSFEEMMALHTRMRRCDGVVCGHIHTPAVKSLGELDYYNCGDWVESCSALLEYDDGQIELVRHHEDFFPSSPDWDLDQLIVTNTIALNGAGQQCKKIVLLSVARLLGQAIRNIHEETSVSSLFV